MDILVKNVPQSASILHINDHYSVRRAVEFYWTSGYPISQAPDKQSQQIKFYKQQGWQPEHLYLNIPKEDHYPIIIKRAQEMIDNGLIDEVKGLISQGYENLKPVQSIGYKETVAFIKGEISTKEELIERIFISTRRLAKSQRTWFQSVQSKKEFNSLTGYSDALKKAKSFLGS